MGVVDRQNSNPYNGQVACSLSWGMPTLFPSPSWIGFGTLDPRNGARAGFLPSPPDRAPPVRVPKGADKLENQQRSVACPQERVRQFCQNLPPTLDIARAASAAVRWRVLAADHYRCSVFHCRPIIVREIPVGCQGSLPCPGIYARNKVLQACLEFGRRRRFLSSISLFISI